MNKKTGIIAEYGIMTALALVLSFVESQFPGIVGIPGVKLGLTNVVVIVALYRRGPKAALIINVVRILLAAALFGSGMSFVYSLAGGMLSWLVMTLLFSIKKLHPVTISIAGGVSHNVGQIIIAIIVLNTSSLAWYLTVLWFSGIISGALIGVLGGIIAKRLPKNNSENIKE